VKALMLRAQVLQQLAISELLVRDGLKVEPRFHLFAEDGEWGVVMPSFGGPAKIGQGYELLQTLMAWKMTRAFVHSTGLVKPRRIMSCGVSRDGVIVAIKRINGRPTRFAEVEWQPLCSR
jgi:hypothetical protein